VDVPRLADSARYCARCRIGTLDAQGHCVLCGASPAPPTRRARAAEALGNALAVVLSPTVLAVVLGAGLVVAVVYVTQVGAQQGAHFPLSPARLGWIDPGALAAQSRADPGGLALRLLLSAILQSLLFGLLLLLVLYLLRRRRPTDSPARRDQGGRGSGVRIASGWQGARPRNPAIGTRSAGGLG
jgi:hypothetical protein